MKAREIYQAALAYVWEYPGEDKDFSALFPAILNGLLAEALPYENALRAAKGLPELDRPPQVAALDDEVPVEPAIGLAALPFGAASYFHQDYGDNFKTQDYRGRFINALRECAVCVPGRVEDVLGGGTC